MLYFKSGDELVQKEKYYQQIDSSKIPEIPFAEVPFEIDKDITSHKPVAGRVRFQQIGMDRGMTLPERVEEREGFQQIGIGKPLTVMIREVYTGKYPENLKVLGLRFGDADMLVTTAIKSSRIFNAQPLAINFHKKEVAKKDRVAKPQASSSGTPFVYYSPALTETSLTLDVKIIFDNFPKDSFDTVGTALQSAATIPLFVPHTPVSTFLLAVGSLTKLTGKLGEKLFDNTPEFSTTESIDIRTPGSRIIPAGFALITDKKNIDAIDKDFLKKCEIDKDGVVRYKSSGETYDGDVPYVVISLDGTPDTQLNDFEPTALTAALISQFFGVGEGMKEQTEILLEGMKLFNDMKYRKEIDELDKRIKQLPDGDEKNRTIERRNALEKNIVNSLFKPTAS